MLIDKIEIVEEAVVECVIKLCDNSIRDISERRLCRPNQA